jgi:Zn-dependent protease
MTCPSCGGELPEAALSCPECRALVHAAKLEDLSRRAQEAWRLGQFAEERALWAESLVLLPEDTVQHQSIADRVAAIDAQLTRVAEGEIAPSAAPDTLAGKIRFLLAGLTSSTTFISMLVSFGIYGRLSGYRSAAGLVISIYIHEMGHLAACLRYAVPASPPVFVPGLGAFIGLRARKIPPIVNSRIGLAGPIYGLGAAIAAMALYYVTRVKTWGLIAHEGAFLNLMNLVPVWQLDGSRGIHSLTRAQRAMLAVAAVALFAVFQVRLLLAVAAVCIYRLFTRDWPEHSDAAGLMQFLWLLIALGCVLAVAPDVGGFLGDTSASLR